MNGIRRAGQGDVAALARVHVACWHESYDGLVPASILNAFSVARGEAVWGRILAEPAAFNGARVVVAELDRQLVGFGSCCAQRSAQLAAAGYDGEVSSIYLLREFQRRGLGSQLMHVLAADLLGRGFATLSLWVLRDNARARAFYERCGGRVVAERTDVRENVPLPEVAYGWPSLAALRDLTAGSGTPQAPHSNG
jgi:ribosomal protein S18 acetylase RimI-like enzyme